MVNGCGNRTVKFLFFTSNLVICLIGVLIFGISLWINLDKDFALKLEQTANMYNEEIVLTKHQASLWILVAFGAFLFLVGFLGCCGAIFESSILLTIFFVIALILTIIQVTVVILAIIMKDQFKNPLYKILSEVGKADDKYLQNLQPIQELFKCCGATEETRSRFVQLGLCEGKLLDKPDCFTVTLNTIQLSREVIIIIAFLLLIIELFALVFTCILCRAFRYQRSYYHA